MAKAKGIVPLAEESPDFEEELLESGLEMPAEASKMHENPVETPAEEPDADAILSMNQQAQVILAKAREKGIEHTFMFTTTFQRYVELISHMAELQKSIKEQGCLVTKEYVKGRQNIYVHPAINAYNATAAQANNTANILMRFIVQPLSDSDDKDEFDIF